VQVVVVVVAVLVGVLVVVVVVIVSGSKDAPLLAAGRLSCESCLARPSAHTHGQ
jgi:hypothetical protein